MQTTLTPEDKPRHGFQHKIDSTCFPVTRRTTTVPISRNWTYEAVQEMKVKARREALDEESIQIAHARACGKIYHAPVFENGDSREQLLARSIYLLYKKESLWTESQRARAAILFREYPDIKKAYKHEKSRSNRC